MKEEDSKFHFSKSHRTIVLVRAFDFFGDFEKLKKLEFKWSQSYKMNFVANIKKILLTAIRVFLVALILYETPIGNPIMVCFVLKLLINSSIFRQCVTLR